VPTSGLGLSRHGRPAPHADRRKSGPEYRQNRRVPHSGPLAVTESVSQSIAQTTPTGHAVARAVAHGYALGDIRDCTLLRRGFNHVYAVSFVDGRRAVARLSAERPRGAPNCDYEAALLAHLKARGAAVAATLAARDGMVATKMALPEGERTLMLFEHLDGDPPGDALVDVEATGRPRLGALARIGARLQWPLQPLRAGPPPVATCLVGSVVLGTDHGRCASCRVIRHCRWIGGAHRRDAGVDARELPWRLPRQQQLHDRRPRRHTRCVLLRFR
jgi:hypothetical protein